MQISTFYLSVDSLIGLLGISCPELEATPNSQNRKEQIPAETADFQASMPTPLLI